MDEPSDRVRDIISREIRGGDLTVAVAVTHACRVWDRRLGWDTAFYCEHGHFVTFSGDDGPVCGVCKKHALEGVNAERGGCEDDTLDRGCGFGGFRIAL